MNGRKIAEQHERVVEVFLQSAHHEYGGDHGVVCGSSSKSGHDPLSQLGISNVLLNLARHFLGKHSIVDCMAMPVHYDRQLFLALMGDKVTASFLGVVVDPDAELG